MNDQLEDFSDNLVGKVSQELLFTEEINALFLKEVSIDFESGPIVILLSLSGTCFIKTQIFI